MLIDEKINDLQNLIKRRVTYEELAPILGVGSGNAIRNWKYRKRPLEEFEIKKIDDAFRDKILEVKNDFQQIKTNYEKGLSNFVNLPVKNNVTASMGYGVEVFDETQTGTYSFSKKLLRDIGADPKYSDVIFSSGDSMYPTIEGGDCLVVDKSKTQIYDGKIYCVRIQDKLYAKRLQFLPPNIINVISDNPKYKSFEVDLSKNLDYDFAVVGEVKWWSRVAR